MMFHRLQITTPFGLFQYLAFRMLVKHYSALFTKFSLDLIFCIDDILVASQDAEEHLSHFWQVFQILADHGLHLNPSKYVFGKYSVYFPGCSITKEGVRPLPDKVEIIANLPQPHSIAELCRFLAIINFYCRFIKNAAQTQAPLNNLLKDSKKNYNHPVPRTEQATSPWDLSKMQR